MAVSETKTSAVRPALMISKQTLSLYPLFLQRLLVGLADASITPTLICPPDSRPETLACAHLNIVPHPWIDLPLTGQINRSKLVGHLQRFKPTVLHCLCETQAPLCRSLARTLGLPYVLTVNTLRRRLPLFSFCAKLCTKLACSTNSIFNELVGSNAKLAERGTVLPPGVFTTENPCCFQSGSASPNVIMTHPLIHAADYDCVFGAIHDLMRNGYDLNVIVMAQGPGESELRRMISALNLTQAITLVPDMQPWRAVLSAGDIFLQPQPTDYINPYLLEAMGVGMAVGACKGGVDDMILPEETALVFDPEDDLSIRSALQQYLDRREYASQLAQGAQAHLRSHYSVSRMADAYIDIYAHDTQVSKTLVSAE